MDKRIEEIKKFWFLSEGEKPSLVYTKKQLTDIIEAAVRDIGYLLNKIEKKK
jgi:hypothetical protein